MTSENALCGGDGNVVIGGVRIARITAWSIDPIAGESAWRDSDSAGYTNRKATFKDLTGSFEYKLDISLEQWDKFREGTQDVAMELWLDDSRYWALPRAVITVTNLAVDNDSQEVIGGTANFGSDGIYYAPGQSGAPSESLPSAPA